MKYLKEYKIFESDFKFDGESLMEDIKDLLIDLEDQGFEVYIEYYGKIQIKICKEVKSRSTNEDLFNYRDIEYYIDRVVSFLKDYGYERYVTDEKKIQTKSLTHPVTFLNITRSCFFIKFINKIFKRI